MENSKFFRMSFFVWVCFCSQVQAFEPFQAKTSEQAAEMNFCGQGKFLIFIGNCRPDLKNKGEISQAACNDAALLLEQGIKSLYPYSSVLSYQDLDSDHVYDKMMRPLVWGFFFIGRGNFKAGFLTGEKAPVYPQAEACTSMYDAFGGFFSHSRFSPDAPAPRSLRGKTLSKYEILYGDTGAIPGSWTKLCKPRMSMVYQSKTLAVNIKTAVKKLVEGLQEAKRTQIMKILPEICKNCEEYAQMQHPAAVLCPPNSEICKYGKILPGQEKLALENYCLAIHPEYAVHGQ
ncbi:MAG: hypothetical protein HY746_09170 [Elusimicrobia bacterium]|nr:hypothetical protein [Elusimicrobiota bacterium]